jgi:hypothetical protein
MSSNQAILPQQKTTLKADSIVNGAIEAHGGKYMTMPITLCV